ncbi:hypothetical protein ACTXT7_008525 [Hymenolepis weldensis]
MQRDSTNGSITNPFILTTTHQAESIPKPELSKYADPDVLAGKKSWPTISSSIVESEPTICILCGVEFVSRSGLQAHLCDHKHLVGKLDKDKHVPLYECKVCSAELNYNNVTKHGCFIKHTKDITKLEDIMNTVGCPVACVFCRGRILPSRAHLMTHIVFSHSPYRNPLRCPFCNLKFHSDNLLMQELHAVEYHAPEIAVINRLACSKQLNSPSGTAVDGKTPFICLYDSEKMETFCWIDAIKPYSDNDKGENPQSPLQFPLNGPCCQTFKTLAEFTSHIYCCHTIIPNLRFMGQELNTSEQRQLDAINKGLPGPSIRDLIKNPITGASRMINSVELERQRLTLTKHACRICLKSFKYEENLHAHINAFHTIEIKKRVQHLTEVGDMDKDLDIYKLCTECFTMFPSIYQLQIHIMVAHGGNSFCNCGICDQRFCEPDQFLPAALTIKSTAPFMDDLIRLSIPEESIGHALSERPSIEKNSSFHEDLNALYEVYEAKLPALILYRIFETHENEHLTNLQPSTKLPYLKANLIKQMLESRGHQAKQVYDWLSAMSDQPAGKEIKPFAYEDPKSMKNRKRKSLNYMKSGEDPLSAEGVEIGQKLLESLTKREQSILQESASKIDYEMPTGNILKHSTLSETSHDTYTTSAEIPSNEKTSKDVETPPKPIVQKGSLPKDLVKLFTSIGQRNLVKEQKNALAEKD